MWGRTGLRGTREDEHRPGGWGEAGRACGQRRRTRWRPGDSLQTVSASWWEPSLLSPSHSLPEDHLPGLGRNHGNRKPKEMTEMLGGHRAARGHVSDFGETGSLSNKGRGDKRASADGSNNRIRPLWDEQAGCGCGQAADGNQLCLGFQCPARELRER